MAEDKKANKFKAELAGNIKDPATANKKENTKGNSLERFKNTTKKPEKKSFPLYMDKEKVDKLDKICKKVGQSRNVLINMIIDEFLEEHS